MVLSREHQLELSDRFPTGVELYSGKRLPRKVPTDLNYIIPAGKRCSVWFTYDKYKGGNTCYMVSEQKEGRIFEQLLACFDDELAYGTVFGGIIIKTPDSIQNIFCIDSVSYYKGVYLKNYNNQKKLNILNHIFNKPEITNISAEQVVKFSLPIFCKSYDEAQSYMEKLPYKTIGVRLLNLKEKGPVGDVMPIASELEGQTFVFLVKANQEPDSYTLFGLDKKLGRRKYAGKAIVFTYKQSKKLNSIFRIIRENDDIDLIEESEDEDTFEDISEHKFIKSHVYIKMHCKYNQKFRKWELLSVATNNTECSDILAVESFIMQAQPNRVFKPQQSKVARVSGLGYYKKIHRK